MSIVVFTFSSVIPSLADSNRLLSAKATLVKWYPCYWVPGFLLCFSFTLTSQEYSVPRMTLTIATFTSLGFCDTSVFSSLFLGYTISISFDSSSSSIIWLLMLEFLQWNPSSQWTNGRGHDEKTSVAHSAIDRGVIINKLPREPKCDPRIFYPISLHFNTQIFSSLPKFKKCNTHEGWFKKK